MANRGKVQGPQVYTAVAMCSCGRYYKATSTLSIAGAKNKASRLVREHERTHK